MEELDLLKKEWQKTNAFEQISEAEIYKMLHKKSSSIVKWLLIIGILEFVFWNIVTVFINDEKYQSKINEYGIAGFMLIINSINYIILLGFIYMFYKNYKTISTTDSTQQLMKNILRTRKTVQNYIWYNLAMVSVTIIITIIMLFNHNPRMISLLQNQTAEGHYGFFVCICVVISIVIILTIIGLFWLFYKLLYGILLKKLFANYKELKKIEL